jgi:hypothetical protein
VLLHGFPQRDARRVRAVPRGFDRDAEDDRAGLARNGNLTVPVLAVGGEISISGALVEVMMRRAPRTGSPRSGPEALAGGLDFVGGGEAAGAAPMVFGP